MIEWLFETASFLPHGICLAWRPDLVAIHVGSDLVTALSYFSIPLAIYWVLAHRKDIPFGPVPALFVLFILLCGLNHLASVAMLYYPAYGAQGLLKVAMAVVSLATAVAVWPLVPKILAIPGQAELAGKNLALQQALQEKQNALDEVERMRTALEIRGKLVEEVINRTASGLSVLDGAGRRVVANAQFDAFQESIGACEDFQAKEVLSDHRRGKTVELTFPQPKASGARKTMRIERKTFQAGADTYVLIEMQDVSAEARAKADKEASERYLWAAIDSIPEGFVLFDKDDRLVLANAAYKELYKEIGDLIEPGVSFCDLQKAKFKSGLLPAPERPLDEVVEEAKNERRRNEVNSAIEQLTDGRWIQRNDKKLATGEVVGIRIDVTDYKQREAALSQARDDAASANARAEHQAKHDALTGLANRRRLNELLEDLEIQPDRPSVSIIAIDLDRFKPINDTYGHAAGDAVLQSVAQAISSTLRDGDFVARVGGDEFVAVISGADRRPKVVEHIAERMLAAAQRSVEWNGTTLRVGASAGCAHSQADQSLQQTLINADLALYRAKSEGRNRLVDFAPSLAREANERAVLGEELRKALEQGDFEPHFQPQFMAGSRALRGAEALARWSHPELGVISPAVFLSIAEEQKLAVELDRLIMRKAVETAQRWREIGVSPPKLSVNVSAKTLKSKSLIDDLSSLDDAMRRSLSIEVLETVFISAEDDSLRWTRETLGEMGVTVELDDFGTGHASVASILAIRPDFLKLDRIFSKDVAIDASKLAVTTSLLGVADSVDIPVIAEGVENQCDAQVLEQAGCYALQGFFFGEPLPEASFAERHLRAKIEGALEAADEN